MYCLDDNVMYNYLFVWLYFCIEDVIFFVINKLFIVSLRLRQVRETQHGQEWTKVCLQEAQESAIMSQNSLHQWVWLFHLTQGLKKPHCSNNHNAAVILSFSKCSFSMQGSQGTNFLLLYAAVDSSTRSWAPGGVCVWKGTLPASMAHSSDPSCREKTPGTKGSHTATRNLLRKKEQRRRGIRSASPMGRVILINSPVDGEEEQCGCLPLHSVVQTT